MTETASTRYSKPETRNLNYFDYFTEIEDTFVRRRGKHLLLSSMDWALIESWKEIGVPLHVALRGIEQAFDSYEAKPRKRSVKTLLYCQEEVEAQYAEWLESRVGASDSEADSVAQQGSDAAEIDGPAVSTFSRSLILEYLQRRRSELVSMLERRKELARDDIIDAIERAISLMADLEKDFTEPSATSPQRLEVSLGGIERMLNESMLAAVKPEELEAIQREVKSQLRPYRSHMEKAAYQKTFENLLLKQLREQFGVPRLSLFYL